MNDVALFLCAEPVWNAVADEEKAQLYDRFQHSLIIKARDELQELLMESLNLFIDCTSDDSAHIHQQLAEDNRLVFWLFVNYSTPFSSYRRMNNLHSMRDAMINDHAQFIANPSSHACPRGVSCAQRVMHETFSLNVKGDDKMCLNGRMDGETYNVLMMGSCEGDVNWKAMAAYFTRTNAVRSTK